MASNLIPVNFKIAPEIKADMTKTASKLNFSLTKYLISLHFMYKQELFGSLLQEMATLIDARNINFLDLKLKDLLILLMTDKEFNQVLSKAVDVLGIKQSTERGTTAVNTPVGTENVSL